MSTQLEMQRDIQDLKAELAALREVLDETFRSAGLMQDWCYAKAQRRAPAPEVVQPRNVAPVATSAVLNAAELRELTRTFFPNGAPTLNEIQNLLKEAENPLGE